jgi:hypothetical protein
MRSPLEEGGVVRTALFLLSKPLRDAFALIVWMASFFPQDIRWRDQQFYVRDKRLVPITRVCWVAGNKSRSLPAGRQSLDLRMHPGR